MNNVKFDKGKIIIEIKNVARKEEFRFEHLNIKVKVKGDMPPSWLAHCIIALCESYKKKMIERKAMILE